MYSRLPNKVLKIHIIILQFKYVYKSKSFENASIWKSRGWQKSNPQWRFFPTIKNVSTAGKNRHPQLNCQNNIQVFVNE